MTPDKLKAALAEQGFKFSQDRLRDTGIDWYAYRRLNGAADCTCNDRAPCLVIHPYHLRMDDRDWYSVEFEVTGEIQGGTWINSKMYSVPMNEALDKLPHIERVLSSVWNTAAAIAA